MKSSHLFFSVNRFIHQWGVSGDEAHPSMPWGTRLRDVSDRSPVHLQAAFPHTHFRSVKWKYEIFMNTLEDHKMHVSPEVPRGRKQNMCFVNIARRTLKRCGFHYHPFLNCRLSSRYSQWAHQFSFNPQVYQCDSFPKQQFTAASFYFWN